MGEAKRTARASGCPYVGSRQFPNLCLPNDHYRSYYAAESGAKAGEGEIAAREVGDLERHPESDVSYGALLRRSTSPLASLRR